MMTIEDLEQQVLLEDSGEHTPVHRSGTASEAVDALREDLATLHHLAEADRQTAAPSAATTAAILDEARAQVAPDAGVIPLPRSWSSWVWRPGLALVAAAALALLVGTFWLEPASDPAPTRDALSVTAALVMVDVAPEDGDATWVADSELSEEERMRALAWELLALQGLDDGYTDEELTTAGEEPPPTAFQSHSTLAPPARVCV